MGIQMSYITQMEIGESIKNGMGVIVPTGATEAHGPHMPTDTDTHQSEYIAIKLAERINALVAPPIAYGVSNFFSPLKLLSSCVIFIFASVKTLRKSLYAL